MKKKIFTIEDKMFKTEPLFLVNCSRREAAKYLKRRFNVDLDVDNSDDDHSRGSASATTLHYPKAPWRVIWIRDFNRHKSEDIAELVHELMHLVIRICEDKGIPITGNHPTTGAVLDEPPAYMMDFFVKSFLDKI